MLDLRRRPANSAIEHAADLDGDVLHWKGATESCVGRGCVGGFLAFWLCGWAFGEIFAIAAVFGLLPHENDQGAAMDVATRLFLLAWLGGWTFGGAAAIWALFNMLRPGRPESVTLGHRRFAYEPGTIRLEQTEDGLSVGMLKRRKRIELPREQAGPFILDRVGERQRLYFDHGSNRIEIGAPLTEPDREWLHCVLEAYAEGR